MPSRTQAVLTLSILVLSAGCAGAPATPSPPPTAVVWPLPPAPARARLIAVHPDPSAPRPRRPWWKVLLAVLTGEERSEADRRSLVRPFGVASGDAGEAYTTDPDAGRVMRIGPDGMIEDLTCAGVEWNAPMAVAVAPDRSLLVADAGAGTIVRWLDGSCQVLGAGELERPTGVAASADRIWVVDPPRHQIVALSFSGTIVARVGELGDGEGRFHFPSALARTRDGRLLVVDALNFRVATVSRDGRWLGAFGAPGTEAGEFARPKGIAVGADDEIFVSDAQRDTVLVFSATGAFEFEIGKGGAEPGRFAHPAGLAVSDGRLLVADSQNRRIQVFELLGGGR